MTALHGRELRNELSSALLDICRAATRLAVDCLDGDSPQGSRAAADQASAINGAGWRSDHAVRNVYENIHFILLAGIDHANTLARTVRRDESASVSLATLARGSVEALGRVYWIITAGDALQLVERYSLIAYADLGDLKMVKPGESLGTVGGANRSTPGQMQQRIADYLAEHDLPAPKKPGATRLTTNLLNLQHPDLAEEAPREAYNDLSAIAHGHPFAVTGFIDRDRHLVLRAPEELISEYTALAGLGVNRVGDAYLEYFRPEAASVARWVTARDRSNLRRAHANLGYPNQ